MPEDRTPRYDTLGDPAIRLEDTLLHSRKHHDTHGLIADRDVTERAEELESRATQDAVDDIVDNEAITNRGEGSPRSRRLMLDRNFD